MELCEWLSGTPDWWLLLLLLQECGDIREDW
jgi:hypothetical protein